MKMPHMQLAGSRSLQRTMCAAIDVHGTHSANSFAAVVIESNRFFAFADKTVIEYIEHFKKRHVRAHSGHIIVFEMTFAGRTFLPPDFKFEVNCFHWELGI